MQRKDGILYTSIVMTGISAGVAVLLAVVNFFTAPIIAERIHREKENAIQSLVPNLEYFVAIEEDIDDVDEFFVVTTSDTEIYCVITNPKGFADGIDMIVAITSERKVIGVQILKHSETAGVGTKIEKDEFLNKFINTTINSVEKDTDIISGATISSVAVKKGVSSALNAVEKYQNFSNS